MKHKETTVEKTSLKKYVASFYRGLLTKLDKLVHQVQLGFPSHGEKGWVQCHHYLFPVPSKNHQTKATVQTSSWLEYILWLHGLTCGMQRHTLVPVILMAVQRLGQLCFQCSVKPLDHPHQTVDAMQWCRPGLVDPPLTDSKLRPWSE